MNNELRNILRLVLGHRRMTLRTNLSIFICSINITTIHFQAKT